MVSYQFCMWQLLPQLGSTGVEQLLEEKAKERDFISFFFFFFPTLAMFLEADKYAMSYLYLNMYIYIYIQYIYIYYIDLYCINIWLDQADKADFAGAEWFGGAASRVPWQKTVGLGHRKSELNILNGWLESQ